MTEWLILGGITLLESVIGIILFKVMDYPDHFVYHEKPLEFEWDCCHND